MVDNPNYRKFLDEGIIKIINEENINTALQNVRGRNVREGRVLIIVLYYTGGRPVEVLELRGSSITRDGGYVIIDIKAAKKGLPRKIYLQYNKPLVKELWEYSKLIHPDMYLFYHYRGNYKNSKMLKKEIKEYIETTAKLRYYFKKWFDGVVEGGINPYYLRHNRFSKMAEKNIPFEHIRLMKGSKSPGGVVPYIHMSSEMAKKNAKKID